MDKYQREQLVNRGKLIVGELSLDMAQSNLVEHANKKYDAMIRELCENLTKVDDLIARREGKGFFAKLGDKINGVSAEDRKIDDILTDCTRQIRRLERCKGCLCIDCIRDDCKFNCSICPDGGCVIDCPGDGEGYCFRQLEKWYVMLNEIGIGQQQYEVLAMLSDLNASKNYLFLKARTKDTRKIVLYNKLNNKMTEITDENEYNRIAESAAKNIGY